MKHLYNQQSQWFNTKRTSFIYFESVDTLSEVGRDTDAPDFLEKKEALEQEILKKMTEKFVAQGDTKENAQKRALESIEQLRINLKSNPEGTIQTDVAHFDVYSNILTAYENLEANTIFDDFANIDPKRILKFTATVDNDLQKAMKESGIKFFRGEKPQEVVFRKDGDLKINRIPAGIVSISPVYDHEDKVIGISTLDGHGEAATSYFEDTHATREFSEETKSPAAGQPLSKHSARGDSTDVERANFGEGGQKHAPDDQPTPAQVNTAVHNVIVTDKYGYEDTLDPTKDTIDINAHKRGIVNITDESNPTNAFYTTDKNGDRVLVSVHKSKEGIIEEQKGEWGIENLTIETDNTVPKEELEHLLKMFYRKIITNHDRKNAIIQKGDKKYQTPDGKFDPNQALDAVKAILKDETIVFTRDEQKAIDERKNNKLVFQVKSGAGTIDENFTLKDSTTNVGEFLTDIQAIRTRKAVGSTIL